MLSAEPGAGHEEFLQFVAELEKRERLFLEALERAKQDPEKMKRLREILTETPEKEGQ